MKTLKWIFVVSLFFNSAQVLAIPYMDGADSSGGGLAVVCRHPDGMIKSVQMADLFDAQNYGLTIVDPGLDMHGNLSLIEKKLKTIFSGVKDKKSPDTLIAKALKEFTLLPANVELAPVNDGDLDFIPKLCKVEQVALYKNNKQLFVDTELWNKMDDLNRAALIVHEAVYLHERELGDKTAKRSRKLVAYLFSDYPFESLMSAVPSDANNCIAYPQNNLGEIAFEFYKYKDPLVADQEILQFTKFRGRYPYSVTRVFTPLWPWQDIDADYFDVDSVIETFDQLFLRKDITSPAGGYYIQEKLGKYLIKCNNSLDATAPGSLTISEGPSFNYGSVSVGALSEHVFTVTNVGGTTITSLSDAGATSIAPPFSYAGGNFPGTSGTCAGSLGAGRSCTIVVVFEPRASSFSNDAIELIYNDGHSLQRISRDLFGTGISPASLSISDGPIYAFGTVAVGESVQKVFTITNSGASMASGIMGSGLSAPFAFQGGTYPGVGGSCGATLAAGTSCTIVVAYSPVSQAVTTGTIFIGYTDGAIVQITKRELNGTGVSQASLSISDGPMYDYGLVAIGSLTPKTFTITNSGGFQANGMGGSLKLPFLFRGGHYPGLGGTCRATLGAGASCTVVVEFAPTNGGAFEERLLVRYSAGASPKTAERSLEATAAAPALLAISNGPTYNYGTQATQSITTFTFTVTNSGAVSAKGITGRLNAPFSFNGGNYPGTGGTCGSSLVSEAYCTIVVSYAPTTVGNHSDTIQISYSDGVNSSSATRDIKGTGVTPALITISDTDPYDFGAVVAGASGFRTFTLTNTGGVKSTGMSGGGLSAPFSFAGGTYPGSGGTCSSILESGESCTVVVKFSPVVSGSANDTMEIQYNGGANQQISSRSVTGTGSAPAFLIISDGPTYDFGQLARGGLATKTLMITNSGAASATRITEVGLAAPFSFLGGTFPGIGGTCGSSLVAGASCMMVLKFAPVVLGLFIDSIDLQYNNGVSFTNTTRQLQGSAVASALLLISDGPIYNFGLVVKGSLVSKTFTVTNSGAFTATDMTGRSLMAPFSYRGGSYPGRGGTCGQTLTAKATCTVIVEFAPQTEQVFNDVLEIDYDNGGMMVRTELYLSGEGVVTAQLVVGPQKDSYDFGQVIVGKTKEVVLTIENTGSAEAVSMKTASSFNHPFQFKGGTYPGTGGTCGVKLAARTTCELVLEFVPTFKDSFVDSIGIFYNNGVSKQVVVYYLSGEGV